MNRSRVAINGFGRIGRTVLRVLLKRDEVDVVSISDLADIRTMAHLFRYDSVHGKWPGEVAVENDHLIIDGRRIRFSTLSDKEIPDWSELRPDVVIESTGTVKGSEEAQRHIQSGAKRVLLSAPADDEGIPNVIMGVNEHETDFRANLLSCASCTTNSAAPMIQLLDELCGIESCYITTVHSYTGDQRLHDAPHKDLRRGRAAAVSIVPTSTGAAKALTRIFPHLADAMGGCGIRVPVPDGSLTDITCNVRKALTTSEINEAFKRAALNRYAGIVEYTEDPVVSADIIDNPHSCVLDAQLTSVIGKMVKVVGWYDNEAGYSNRLADVIRLWMKHEDRAI